MNEETAKARRALITGSAGFVGYHLAARLLAEGWAVTGVDSLSAYYDVALKQRRHAMLAKHAGFRAVIGLVEEPGLLAGLMRDDAPELLVHLAAQAGVRHSLEAPRDYVAANLLGTFEVLEAARAHPPAHLMLASTSSVYGANTDLPYGETDAADHPLSFYAATKKAGEAMAHSYAHLYALPVTMFRFFTVYGPWGRPDMALFRFVDAVLKGAPIEIYNHGEMQRDFTYIDDLVEGIVRLAARAPTTGPVGPHDSLSRVAPFRVVNIGNGAPLPLMAFVAAIEEALGRVAEKRFLPMQAGDVPATWADTRLIEALVGALPRTDVAEGVRRFVAWYREYYRL